MAYMFGADASSTTVHLSVSDNESFRIERLHRVIGYVVALAEYFGNESIVEKLASLDDHEGNLTVTWRTSPSDGQKQFFAKAWSSMIGDGCDMNIEHVHSSGKGNRAKVSRRSVKCFSASYSANPE